MKMSLSVTVHWLVPSCCHPIHSEFKPVKKWPNIDISNIFISPHAGIHMCICTHTQTHEQMHKSTYTCKHQNTVINENDRQWNNNLNYLCKATTATTASIVKSNHTISSSLNNIYKVIWMVEMHTFSTFNVLTVCGKWLNHYIFIKRCYHNGLDRL